MTYLYIANVLISEYLSLLVYEQKAGETYVSKIIFIESTAEIVIIKSSQLPSIETLDA